MVSFVRLLILLPVVLTIHFQGIPVSPSPTPMPPPTIRLSDNVVEHIRIIHLVGRGLGNRDDVFSKVGDSITVSFNFMVPFGVGDYQLGAHSYLEPLIEAFNVTNAREGNSFLNRSLAAGVGWTAFGALDPERADPERCNPGEMPLLCEYRLTRPAYAIIMFGTNDSGFADLSAFEYNLERIVSHSIRSGVIPILSTIPNRPLITERVERFNAAIRRVADAEVIPLIEYAAALADLPNEGLSEDLVHPSQPPRDEATTGNLRTPYLQYGYNMRNLTALEMLYAVRFYLTSSDD